MRTVVDLDEDLLEAARRELGTTTKKDTIHAALRLISERSARLAAVADLLSVDRDWTGILDADKAPSVPSVSPRSGAKATPSQPRAAKATGRVTVGTRRAPRAKPLP